ncbi:MAG: hypothetical protein ABSE95_16700 [Thermodesulfobacteriota bacterium]|jgi:hypothetical protein
MKKMNSFTVLVTLREEGRKKLRELAAEQNLKNPDKFITPSGLAREIINQYLFNQDKERED